MAQNEVPAIAMLVLLIGGIISGYFALGYDTDPD